MRLQKTGHGFTGISGLPRLFRSTRTNTTLQKTTSQNGTSLNRKRRLTNLFWHANQSQPAPASPRDEEELAQPALFDSKPRISRRNWRVGVKNLTEIKSWSGYRRVHLETK